jgi:hypothetical protein
MEIRRPACIKPCSPKGLQKSAVHENVHGPSPKNTVGRFYRIAQLTFMTRPFTDIRITGLNADATEQSPTAPGLRLMYLSLSEAPPDVWCQIFAAERQFPRHSMWRRAWTDGASIVVDCVPEELEQHHLRDVKEDVANSNAKFRDFLTQEARRTEAAQQAEQRERDRIEEVKKRLKFD